MSKNPIEQRSMQEFQGTSYLSGGNAGYVEDLYESYISDPNTVTPEWRQYFESISNGTREFSHAEIREQFRELAKQPHYSTSVATTAGESKQGYVDGLITAYRRFGHINAKIDPLGHTNPPDSRLQLAQHKLSDADLESVFLTRGLRTEPQASLKQIIATLQSIYCNSVGVEYTRIMVDEEREWLRDYIERKLPNTKLSADVKRDVLRKLVAAEGLEKYLDSKYPGQKRFSVEGIESTIPMLDQLIHTAASQQIKEIVFGMAHRGRLNVLLNIMGQSPAELFQEFDGTKDYGMTTGDVKYHKGFSSDVETAAGPVHLSLGFNPSHLEFINTVVMGSVRARQDRNYLLNSNHLPKSNYALAVLLHGDAAFAGQGIVMETLSMSQTRAYNIGGTIHIILNNQIGFTTSNPEDARSSMYCSDLAKMIDAPIFHINADDVEAGIKIMQLCVDYRAAFKKDIVIDLVGFRRHGHQEVDEPRATQPMMYKKIKDHPTVQTMYSQRLIQEGVCSEADLNSWMDNYRAALDEGRQVVDVIHEGLSQHYAANWTPFIDCSWSTIVDTTVSLDKLKALGKCITNLPQGFALQRNVEMIMKSREKMTAGELPLDWGYAETLAYASLLCQGYPIRFSGEDCQRGTFFHRHAVVHDQNTGATYMPLAHLQEGQKQMQIYDSLLSETGALGFEYGYSTAEPNTLVLWEAQFGDFANVAQVIVDQFISSGWQKWNRLSGLVMLLPHGYEGMGPEHSSARLERYLQLCAQSNIQVFVPTTPSQIFHLLRRQVLRPYRRPLIVMTPKSLLRHKLAVSAFDDLSSGQLQLVIPEMDNIPANNVKRIVLCTGKVYYELLEKRRAEGVNDVAIIRIEQLYPFPYDEVKMVFANYRKAKQLVWCQEEPKNQGAWFCTRDRLLKCMPSGLELRYAGRKSMAAPAGGYPSLHIKQQADLIEQALNLKELQDIKLYHS